LFFLLRFSAFQPRSDITRKAAFSPETPLKKAGLKDALLKIKEFLG